MDNPSQIPSFEIPKSAEQAPIYKGAPETDPQLAIEGTREILPSPLGSNPLQSPTQGVVGQPLGQPVMTSSTGMQAGLPADDSHVIAEDNDVIEKEWVDRAKKIISLTSNDPYVEAKEMNKLKATYMKKRFNKELPQVDEKTP